MENEQQFFENRQSYMIDNNSQQQLNVASAGDRIVGGAQAEVLSGVAGEILGGKYDENHEEHDVDDDELKYAEEVQQSEKQQQQLQTLKNFGLEDDGTFVCNELAEKETSNKATYEFGNGGFVFGGDHQEKQHDLFNVGNGHDTNGHVVDNLNEELGDLISTGFEKKLNIMKSDFDCFKNDGDTSSTSNVTESVEGFVPQIDVKIETKVEHQEMVDEEEPSSLATNTTNGTSSLSENVPPQAVTATQANEFDDCMVKFESKDNPDLLTSQRPNELELEQAHSQLNPEAKEFIPSFGSNPASPTSPFATGISQNEPVLSEIMETQMYFGQAPNAVPHHLFSDDDFVAESPRKGKGDNNMDAVSLPRELAEFEQEADKRPHELEPENIECFNQRDEVMTPDQAIQQLPLDDIDTQDKENQPPSDSIDFHSSNFIDHGPETCVDLEADLEVEQSKVLPFVEDTADVMKRSMYVANVDGIEDVLNSVQPIPTEIDSDNSFIEEMATESIIHQLAGDKELLQVEEKEHVSHSPSTEEIQMNLQNTFNSSNKDIPQLPMDMDNAINMQESFYVQQGQQTQDQEQNKQFQDEMFEQLLKPSQAEEQKQQQQLEEFSIKTEEEIDDVKQQETENTNKEEQLTEKRSLDNSELHPDPIADTILNKVNEQNTSAVLTHSSNVTDNFFDDFLKTQESHESFSPFEVTHEVSNTHANESLEIDASKNREESISSNEKHLIEETKEQHLLSVSGLEQQMSDLILNKTDGSLSQAEEISFVTDTAVIEDISDNLITPDEPIAPEEQHQDHQELDQSQEQLLVDDSFKRHEQECLQIYQEELQQQKNMNAENKSDSIQKSPIEQQLQQELESEKICVEEPISESKQTAPIFINEETEFTNAIINTERQEPEATVKPNETEIIQSQAEQPQQITEEFIIDEPVVEKLKENETETEIVKEEVVVEPEINTDVPVDAIVAAAAATASIAATVATAPKIEPLKNKSELAKKPLAKGTVTATKPKVGLTTAAKKPIEPTKKPVALAAKPRTAPTKPVGMTIEKKPINKTNATTTATTATRKILSSATTATKVTAKTTNSTLTTRTATATPRTTAATKPTTAPRTLPLSSSAARKPATTTNGPLAKPRSADRAPTKPTTLGLPGTNGAPKTKPLSPRTNLTSQVRKTTPGTTAAKSPIKTTATNGVTKTASSNVASRTKSTTTTVSTTATTVSKTFTARPAPKFTNSSSTTTTSTTARRSTGGISTTSSTVTTTKPSSASLRKTTPTKPTSAKTPTKTTTTAGGLKPKPITKTISPAAKPAPIRKPTVVATIINGEINKDLNGTAEGLLKEATIDNANLQAVQLDQQQNGDSSISLQTEDPEQSFLQSKLEKIPMDSLNA